MESKMANNDRQPQEGEPDFIETNCHWKGCNKEHDSQAELVKVSPPIILLTKHILTTHYDNLLFSRC